MNNLLAIIGRGSSGLSEIPRGRAIRAVYLSALAGLCAAVGLIGHRISGQTNHDLKAFDQDAYSLMVRQMKGSWYPWYSDGTRNPLVPWLAALALDPGHPAFLEHAKKLNVLIAVGGTALLGLFFATRFGPLAAFNATALAALGALLPLGTFFGAETLFLVLFFFVCACGMRLLNENPLWLYLLLGVCTALAWLAKSSTTPFIGLFMIFSILRLGLNLRGGLPWFLSAPGWTARRFFLGFGIFAAAYLALIAPRLIHAQRTWGSAFYSLPSFWFWADDWDTCVTKYYDCRKVKLATFPPEEQPTLAGYFRRHTTGDAIQRLTHGAGVRLGQFFFPEEKWRFPYEKKGKPKRVVLPYRGLYIAGLGLLAAAPGAVAIQRRRLSRIGPVGLPVLLGAATFALYVAAMGWYLPVGPGHRFMMTLFIPVLWMLIQGGEQLRRAADSRLADGLFLAGHFFIAVLLASRVLLLLQNTSFEKVVHAF